MENASTNPALGSEVVIPAKGPPGFIAFVYDEEEGQWFVEIPNAKEGSCAAGSCPKVLKNEKNEKKEESPKVSLAPGSSLTPGSSSSFGTFTKYRLLSGSSLEEKLEKLLIKTYSVFGSLLLEKEGRVFLITSLLSDWGRRQAFIAPGGPGGEGDGVVPGEEGVVLRGLAHSGKLSVGGFAMPPASTAAFGVHFVEKADVWTPRNYWTSRPMVDVGFHTGPG